MSQQQPQPRLDQLLPDDSDSDTGAPALPPLLAGSASKLDPSMVPQGPPTLADAASRISWSDLSWEGIKKLPCAPQALLTGLMAGSLLGVVRFSVTRRLRSAANWGMFAFAGSSAVSWEFCRFQRKVVAQQLDFITKEQEERSRKAALAEKLQQLKEQQKAEEDAMAEQAERERLARSASWVSYVWPTLRSGSSGPNNR
ncbi:hypothetical protein BC831DRAFT_451730 [Entophlyctis helioformis]|nr:hypothetical protein BC831DRAFT_451730 [Entophlyctis helioformis]